jgi:hypothetical protein
MKRTAAKTWVPCVTGLLGAVLLWLAAQPAAGALPGIKLSSLKISQADARRTEGAFTITNDTEGGLAVQLEQFAMAFQWIGIAGVRADCRAVRFQWTIGGTTVAPGRVIPGNTTVRVDYVVACDHDPPFLARELKNFVAIKLVGRSKIFGASGSFRYF